VLSEMMPSTPKSAKRGLTTGELTLHTVFLSRFDVADQGLIDKLIVRDHIFNRELAPKMQLRLRLAGIRTRRRPGRRATRSQPGRSRAPTQQTLKAEPGLFSYLQAPCGCLSAWCGHHSQLRFGKTAEHRRKSHFHLIDALLIEIEDSPAGMHIGLEVGREGSG
jgi:hypothetical protein